MQFCETLPGNPQIKLRAPQGWAANAEKSLTPNIDFGKRRLQNFTVETEWLRASRAQISKTGLGNPNHRLRHLQSKKQGRRHAPTGG